MRKVVYPYLRHHISGAETRIEVMADSMRVGKTTAVNVIAEGLRQAGHTVTESYEDWQNNPYLKEQYRDPSQKLLESQKWFVRRKWEQLRSGGEGMNSTGSPQVFVQDVPPEMDYNYVVTNWSLGRVGDAEMSIYDSYYRMLEWSVIPAPTVLVYLTASDEVLLQRAIDSRREFETVEPEYYLMMKKVNRKWLKGVECYPQYKIVEVDTDKVDFAHRKRDQAHLVNEVLKNM